PPSAGGHRVDEGASDVEDAVQVRVDDGVPGALIHLSERAIAGDAGVVDEDVDALELPVHPGADARDVLGHADVEGVDLGAPPHSTDLVAYPGGRLDARGARSDGDVRPG